MPTYRELAEALGCSKFLVRTLVDELDPAHEHVTKRGKTYLVDDYLASAIAHDAQGRGRGKPVGDDGGELSALAVLERSHAAALEAVRAESARAQDAIRDAARETEDALREQLSERDRRIAQLEADNAALRETLDGISSSKWYTRAFSLHRLLPRGSLNIK